MKHTLSMLAIGALVAISTCPPAQAGQGWAATATKVVGPDIIPAVRKDAMKAGEPVRVALALNMHDKAGLDAQVAGLLSGRVRHPLTGAEFLARHAPTPAEAQAVADHLRQSGFTNIEIAKNRMLVTADGTAAAVKTAFNTELSHFDVDGRAAYANTTEAQVPARLGGIVHAVLGLQTVAIGHSMATRVHAAAGARSAAATSGKGLAVVHEAPDFSTLYGADSLPPATNATIAIFTLGDVSQTLVDLDSFTAALGYPKVDVKTIATGPASGDTSGLVEWAMDTQASLAAAGGQVKQMLLYVGTDFADASIEAQFNAFVSDNLAQTFNNSWGGCELANTSSGLQQATDVLFEIAIAQGQTIAASSGDSGSYTCGTKKGGQSYPAVSPWVMAIGGTTVYTRNGSPTRYVKEDAWSCYGKSDCFNFGGTGGGASLTETAPSWQLPVTGKRMRAIPDVAFDADPVSGLDIMYFGTFDPLYPIGGTSLSAPIFSGLWSRLQSMHGNKLMFPGMSLYGLHATDGVIFHDVTVGQNGGYQTAAGWDAVTGFGSFDAAKFNDFIDANPGAFGGPR